MSFVGCGIDHASTVGYMPWGTLGWWQRDFPGSGNKDIAAICDHATEGEIQYMNYHNSLALLPV